MYYTYIWMNYIWLQYNLIMRELANSNDWMVFSYNIEKTIKLIF